MGCSNNSVNEKTSEKSFSKYINFYTIEKYEPNLKKDYGTVSFLELESDIFLVSTQNNKIILYDLKTYKAILAIPLQETANIIIKTQNNKILFGDDIGKIFILEINLQNTNKYNIINAYSCKSSITKIIEYKEDKFIVSSYKEILFLNFGKDNKLILKQKLKDHLAKTDIYNIYLVDNLLFSFSYEQKRGDKNEIIIYDLDDNNKIVRKEEKASVIPWCNTVCKFNSELLAITGNRCEICIFEIKTFKVLEQIMDIDFFYCVFCIGKKIFCGGDSGKLYEFEYNYEYSDLKMINEFQIHDSSIFSINRISSGAIVTTSRDGTIKFFR